MTSPITKYFHDTVLSEITSRSVYTCAFIVNVSPPDIPSAGFDFNVAPSELIVDLTPPAHRLENANEARNIFCASGPHS